MLTYNMAQSVYNRCRDKLNWIEFDWTPQTQENKKQKEENKEEEKQKEQKNNQTKSEQEEKQSGAVGDPNSDAHSSASSRGVDPMDSSSASSSSSSYSVPVSIERWIELVQSELPSGWRYSEKLLFFRHVDPDRIVEFVISSCVKLFSIPEHSQPRFAMGCYIHTMPAEVCTTRILVAVTYKPDKFETNTDTEN